MEYLAESEFDILSAQPPRPDAQPSTSDAEAITLQQFADSTSDRVHQI